MDPSFAIINIGIIYKLSIVLPCEYGQLGEIIDELCRPKVTGADTNTF